MREIIRRIYDDILEHFLAWKLYLNWWRICKEIMQSKNWPNCKIKLDEETKNLGTLYISLNFFHEILVVFINNFSHFISQNSFSLCIIFLQSKRERIFTKTALLREIFKTKKKAREKVKLKEKKNNKYWQCSEENI